MICTILVYRLAWLLAAIWADSYSPATFSCCFIVTFKLICLDILVSRLHYGTTKYLLLTPVLYWLYCRLAVWGFDQLHLRHEDSRTELWSSTSYFSRTVSFHITVYVLMLFCSHRLRLHFFVDVTVCCCFYQTSYRRVNFTSSCSGWS